MMLIIQNFLRPTAVADGRWIFINGNNTPRIARVDFQLLKQQKLLKYQIPEVTTALHSN
jgi:nitrous oxide reductase